MSQTVVVKLEPLVSPAPNLLSNPILLAAIVTFAGVFLTIFVGTIANFILARQRNSHEKDLAERKMEIDLGIARDRLAQEAEATNDEKSTELRLRRIDFQRATLLEIQESVVTVARLIREDANGAANAREYWDQNARFSMHVSRLADNDLRIGAVTVRQNFIAACAAKGEEAAGLTDAATKSLAQFMIKVGDALRKLDDAELKEVAA